MALSDPHGYGSSALRWRVTAQGVGIGGHGPVGSEGEPETARRVLSWFGDAIAAAATQTGVPQALLIAIVCNESAGGGGTHQAVCTARREEPGYSDDATTPARVSTGCCQTLLSTARAVLHNTELTSLDLENPATSIKAAACYIAAQKHLTNFDPPLVAAAYNAGGLHDDPSPANRWHLRCYPIGTSAYIDRFCMWYNDAVAVLASSPSHGS